MEHYHDSDEQKEIDHSRKQDKKQGAVTGNYRGLMISSRVNAFNSALIWQRGIVGFANYNGTLTDLLSDAADIDENVLKSPSKIHKDTPTLPVWVAREAYESFHCCQKLHALRLPKHPIGWQILRHFGF
ncbi:hypothetical protein TNIN_123301 [Trichonephila inaurata madagascariensis]|uniref:Uncharacterized protein n=1 Tax=Trichonephila inaurata madagascariensis TaxID=2747483 RepID=A0A8X6MJN9_9ARAC|nr:hypothetical protein TNIN_123301 [Trichonephila inaurata madagascariensis]